MKSHTPQEVSDAIVLIVDEQTNIFNELIKVSLCNIADSMSEDDCTDILEIRDKYGDLITYCLFFAYKGREDLDNNYFEEKLTNLLVRFYEIVVPYYKTDDFNQSKDLHLFIEELNKAEFVNSNEDTFTNNIRPLKGYINSALKYFTTKQTSQANQLIIANTEKPLPVSEILETKAESLNKKLCEHGFFELDKVKDIKNKNGFVELLAADKGGKGKSCSYIIAMLYHLEFIQNLEKKYVTNNKKVLYNTLTKITGFEPESIKKNINNIDREHKVFKSYSYKNVVKEDLNTYIHTN